MAMWGVALTPAYCICSVKGTAAPLLLLLLPKEGEVTDRRVRGGVPPARWAALVSTVSQKQELLNSPESKTVADFERESFGYVDVTCRCSSLNENIIEKLIYFRSLI